MEQTAALANPRHSHAAAVNLALARLDAGIRVTAVAQCDEAVAQLRALEPGLLDHLKAAAPLSEVAVYVARHYPY